MIRSQGRRKFLTKFFCVFQMMSQSVAAQTTVKKQVQLARVLLGTGKTSAEMYKEKLAQNVASGTLF